MPIVWAHYYHITGGWKIIVFFSEDLLRISRRKDEKRTEVNFVKIPDEIFIKGLVKQEDFWYYKYSVIYN